jgi:large repetitive protein
MTTRCEGYLERGSSTMKKVFVALLTAVLAALGLMVPAWAVVNEPPTPNHEVLVFPERDFVVAGGYPEGTQLNIRLIRNGVVIGTASGAAPPLTDPEPFQVNHPGGVCWDNFTPNILPGDRVEVLSGPDEGDRVVTANVTAEQAQVVGDTVVVHGTAQDETGNPIPIDQLEQRIIQPDFRNTPGSFIGRRDIRADSLGGRIDKSDNPDAGGRLRYDAPGSIHWTATYTGLNSTERQLAAEGETRIMSWMALVGGERVGITIYEAELTGGPGMPECPAAAEYAVASSNPRVVNAATVGRPLVLSGVSQDASAVSVTLDDQSSATQPVTVDATDSLSAPTGAQSWKATIPAAQVASLRDGMLRATGAYTVAGGTINGVNLQIPKDTVAPRPPTATPKAGTYARSQAVTLNSQAGTEIHYTVNGSTPTARSPLYSRQIRVSATQTIKAIAIDKAGNKSTVASFRYVIRHR